jgi:thioesterase domain-containing protein
MSVLGQLVELWSDCLGPAAASGRDPAELDLSGAAPETLSPLGRQVSALCGVKLPGVLFGTCAPTPAAAAALIEGLTPGSPLREAPAHRLLPLRAGDGAAVVLAAPSEPALLAMLGLHRELVRVVAPDVAILGVAAYDPYRPGWRRPLTEHADRLGGLLRQLPHRAPVVLAGYSAGGHIAHEAGASLTATGRDVSVVLLDTFCRIGFTSVPRSPLERLRHGTSGMLTRLPDPIGRRVVLPRERRRGVQRVAAGMPATSEGALLEWLRSRTLSWHHRPTTGSFPELLVTTAPSARILGDPALGWHAVRTDRLFQVRRVDGDHRSFLDPPYAAGLVQAITSFAGSSLGEGWTTAEVRRTSP